MQSEQATETKLRKWGKLLWDIVLIPTLISAGDEQTVRFKSSILKHAEILDNLESKVPISANLRREFAINGVKLSESATIEKEDSTWLITDNENKSKYSLKKTEANIYLKAKSPDWWKRDSIAIAAITFFAVLFILFLGEIGRWKKIKFKDYFSISNEPQTIFHYLIFTLKQHKVAYLAFIVIPLSIACVFKASELQVLVVWGVLITTIGAFYATKAFEKSEETLSAVIHFAQDFRSFIRIVRYDLERITDAPIHAKFLTVIPAFGSVGEEEKEFHNDLRNKISTSSGKLKILTHNGLQTAEWYSKVLRAQAGVDPKDETITEKLKTFYSEQKEYVKKTIGGMGPDYLVWRIWNHEKISSFKITKQSLENLKSEGVPDGVLKELQSLKNRKITGKEAFLDILREKIGDEQTGNFDELILKHAKTNQPPISIPFQFLILSHGQDKKVYFLFSGSYLFDFLFGLDIDMEHLIMLAKGYYDETDLADVYDKMFVSLFSKMDRLDHTNIEDFYGDNAVEELLASLQ